MRCLFVKNLETTRFFGLHRRRPWRTSTIRGRVTVEFFNAAGGETNGKSGQVL